MKKCSKCGIEKPLTEFYKDNRSMGHRSHCKSCTAKRKAKHYVENKEKIAKQKAKWYVENKEKILKHQKDYRAENPEKIAKYYAKKKAEQPNCVYLIRNLETDKLYVGETTTGELRWKDHLQRLRGNRHPNKLLQEDFDKYGKEAFEWSIRKEFEDGDKDNLLLEEARTIQQFITEGVELYNVQLTNSQLKMLTENK